MLADHLVGRGPSALEGFPLKVSEDEESPELAMIWVVYLLCASCSFLLLASASFSSFCSSLA